MIHLTVIFYDGKWSLCYMAMLYYSVRTAILRCRMLRRYSTWGKWLKYANPEKWRGTNNKIISWSYFLPKKYKIILLTHILHQILHEDINLIKNFMLSNWFLENPFLIPTPKYLTHDNYFWSNEANTEVWRLWNWKASTTSKWTYLFILT